MTSNKNKVGKFVIVKDLDFSDIMTDVNGKIKIYDNLEEACETCGIYEFEDALVLQVVFNHVE